VLFFVVGQVHSRVIQLGAPYSMIHSGYEAYDKLSPTYKKFLEGLTAVHDGSGFIKVIFKSLVEK
jgi:hypothetical protein